MKDQKRNKKKKLVLKSGRPVKSLSDFATLGLEFMGDFHKELDAIVIKGEFK